MIRTKHWHDFPSKLVREALPRFTWAAVGEDSPGVATAALMLYVVLRFMADDLSNEHGGNAWVTRATYEELGVAASLSRTMIHAGLQRLQTEQLITAEGSHQQRRYRLVWSEPGWFKLPCLAIVTTNRVLPFQCFSLRSKHELHAMKLYLYIAAVRPNQALHTEVSYEKIHERLGISERDVRKAISLLLTCGLLANSDRDNVDGTSYGPNKYYLTGYRNILRDGAVKAIEDIVKARRYAVQKTGFEDVS